VGRGRLIADFALEPPLLLQFGKVAARCVRHSSQRRKVPEDLPRYHDNRSLRRAAESYYASGLFWDFGADGARWPHRDRRRASGVAQARHVSWQGLWRFGRVDAGPILRFGNAISGLRFPLAPAEFVNRRSMEGPRIVARWEWGATCSA
jgi:hypothetical protein